MCLYVVWVMVQMFQCLTLATHFLLTTRRIFSSTLRHGAGTTHFGNPCFKILISVSKLCCSLFLYYIVTFLWFLYFYFSKTGLRPWAEKNGFDLPPVKSPFFFLSFTNLSNSSFNILLLGLSSKHCYPHTFCCEYYAHISTHKQRQRSSVGRHWRATGGTLMGL